MILNEDICNFLIPTNFETKTAGITNPNGDVSTEILRFWALLIILSPISNSRQWQHYMKKENSLLSGLWAYGQVQF